MVDANASFTIKDINIFKELDKYNLLMIEQPLQYNDIVDHAELQKQIETPICLDESAMNYHLVDQALKIGACKIVNIKPQRVGGYWQAKKISELCNEYGVPVWCGGMIESGWGQLFNCAIATLPNFKYENDICLSKWYLADDILTTPIEEVNGIINVNETKDLFKIDEAKFKKYTVSKILVE
jgi:o-succinylbenzoate synthase